MYKTILDLSAAEAAEFLLRQESYVNWDLPIYYQFEPLLQKLNASMNTAQMGYINDAKEKENVNFQIEANKDGQYSWRSLQLIHPLLYVHLVHLLTYKDVLWKEMVDRFKEFQQDEHIECYSIPVVPSKEKLQKESTILNWWNTVEQRTIELALDYSCCLYTDISNCYPSIYTHSIAWAMHTREYIKTLTSQEADKTFGGSIDVAIRRMQNAQTNGIPQGSVLMDLIAELVLGYADSLLTKSIADYNEECRKECAGVPDENNPLLITDYHILRYRDDYRIFANNAATATLITKLLSEVLQILNMRLNTPKTKLSTDIISDGIKADKLYWNKAKHHSASLQRTLLLIRDMAILYPNSGSVEVALHDFYDNLTPLKTLKEGNTSTLVFASILVDIAAHNPRTYKMVSAILSEILELETDEELVKSIFDKIDKKFKTRPYAGLLQVWLQRLTIKRDASRKYNNNLCKAVTDADLCIWNNEWIADTNILQIFHEVSIVNRDMIKTLPRTMSNAEVALGMGY